MKVMSLDTTRNLFFNFLQSL